MIDMDLNLHFEEMQIALNFRIRSKAIARTEELSFSCKTKGLIIGSIRHLNQLVERPDTIDKTDSSFNWIISDRSCAWDSLFMERILEIDTEF